MQRYKGSVLIVDDDKVFCDVKTMLLEASNYKVSAAQSADQVMEILRSAHFDLVLLDLNIGDTNGIDILKEIKKFDPDIVVMMITGFSDVSSAVEAMKEGAYDYLAKNVEDEELLVKIDRAIDNYLHLVEIRNLKGALTERFGFENIIGVDEAMKRICGLVKDVCNSEATVLICGETGSGKELIAKAVHFNSNRKDKPFIAVNCAAISEHLMESELFGHEKGAFTDAYKQRIGKLEFANEGTVFLDEIGDMSINLQAKLLRFLQDKSFERVGGNIKITSDVRVITATNKNLPQLIKEGGFREDLYYRINIVHIDVPPLRERLDDIPLLVEYFIKTANINYSKQIKGFSKEAYKKLRQYSWPGNVRELENIINRVVLTSKKDSIEEADVSNYIMGQEVALSKGVPRIDVSFKEARAEFEKQYLKGLLKKYYSNINLIAEKSGLNRKSIFVKLKKYAIDKEDFKPKIK